MHGGPGCHVILVTSQSHVITKSRDCHVLMESRDCHVMMADPRDTIYSIYGVDVQNLDSAGPFYILLGGASYLTI